MRNGIHRIGFALLALRMTTLVAAAQTPQAAQNPPSVYETLMKANKPSAPAPKRDLIGTWAGPIGGRVEPVAPMTALGQKMASLNKGDEYTVAERNDPLNTCDPLGIPRNLAFETRGIAFSTMPDRIVVLHQYQRIWRYVWMDGKHELPKKFDTKDGVPSRWYGYSVGHWDGDHTLVIDTTGSNDQSWVDKAGYPHTVNAMIEERYTRADHNHMQAVITVDDPAIFTKPFTLSTNDYQWIPDQEAEEQMCVPSEMIHYMNLIARPSFGTDEEPKTK